MPLSLPPLAKLTVVYTIPPTPYGGPFFPYLTEFVEYYEGSITSAKEALELWKQVNPHKNIYTVTDWPQMLRSN